jgi:hypothetical protein
VLDPAVPVGVAVDGGVELVVRAEGLQEQVPWRDVDRGQRVGRDVCLAVRGLELQGVAGAVGELEASRMRHALLEGMEPRNDVGDVAPDDRVVLGHPGPVASQATALAPFSQNSAALRRSGSGHAHDGQSKPSMWFIFSKVCAARFGPISAIAYFIDQ